MRREGCLHCETGGSYGGLVEALERASWGMRGDGCETWRKWGVRICAVANNGGVGRGNGGDGRRRDMGRCVWQRWELKLLRTNEKNEKGFDSRVIYGHAGIEKMEERISSRVDALLQRCGGGRFAGDGHNVSVMKIFAFGELRLRMGGVGGGGVLLRWKKCFRKFGITVMRMKHYSELKFITERDLQIQ